MTFKNIFLIFSFLFASFSYAGYYPFGDIHWKSPVASVATLPASGNQPADARVTLDTFNIYVWTGLIWADQSGSGSTVPGGANGDVQFNNGGTFGGNSGFIYDGNGSIALTSVAASSISSTGAGRVQIIANDTSGGQYNDLQFQNNGTPSFDLFSGNGQYLEILDDTASVGLLQWTSANSLQFGAGNAAFVQYTFESGSGQQVNMNDTTGKVDFQFQNSGAPIFDLYAGFGGTYLNLLDDTTGLNLLSWDSTDDLTMQNSAGSGAPALQVVNNGSNPFSIFTSSGINSAGTTQLNSDGSGSAASGAFTWSTTGDSSFSGIMNINPNDANGGNSFTLTDSRGPGFATNMDISNPENSGVNVNYGANMSLGGAAIAFNFNDLDTSSTIGIITQQKQGPDFVLSFNSPTNPGPAMLSIDETNFTVDMLTLSLLGQAPAPAVSAPGDVSFYYDANNLALYTSQNANAWQFLLSQSMDVSQHPGTPMLLSFTGLTEGQFILGGDRDPGFDNWTDMQFLTREGPGSGGLQFDIYTGPGAPHGAGYYTVWDALTSKAMESFDTSDNVTFPSAGSFTTGTIPNNPTASQPGCGSSIQGMIWNLARPGVGADLLQICQDTTGSGSFAWVTH